MFTKSYINIINAHYAQNYYSNGSYYYLYNTTTLSYKDVSNTSYSYVVVNTGGSSSTATSLNNAIKFFEVLYLHGYTPKFAASSLDEVVTYLGVTTKSTLSADDYDFDFSNGSKLSASVASNGATALTVTNNTESSFSFNTIQVGARVRNALPTQATTASNILFAELDVGAITLAPNESKTFLLTKENIAS